MNKIYCPSCGNTSLITYEFDISPDWIYKFKCECGVKFIIMFRYEEAQDG